MQSADAVHARADVGHAGELEQPLHRAVLAERPVQHGEDDVDLAEHRRRRLAHGHRQRSPLSRTLGLSPLSRRQPLVSSPREPGSSAQRPSRPISIGTAS